MKILFAAAEVAPYAKVGGLADVAGSLPKFLKEKGHDIRVIMPYYGSINSKKWNIKDVEGSKINIQFGLREFSVYLKQAKLPGTDVTVYFVVNRNYFGSHSEVYPSHAHARFEQEKFLVFGLAVLELMKKTDFKPDIIHCNDWHTANIPVLLKTNYASCDFFRTTKTVFTIHNLSYQGEFSFEILEFANIIDNSVYGTEGLEFYGRLNWMKGGIIYSDQVNTVSPTYAHEIQTPEYGERLDGLLKSRNYKLEGILNGIDYSLWNPEEDKAIARKYSKSDLTGKKVCKEALQKEFNLGVDQGRPLIGLISRLVDQKGIDLVGDILELFRNKKPQFVILGSGQDKYERLFSHLSGNSTNIRAVIGFDNDLAGRIYSGSDMFLMPSRFEPCGLSQIIALKYGSIPIARTTGGLSDTIIDYEKNKNMGNGFLFDKYDSYALFNAISRAVRIFENRKEWDNLLNNALNSDYSWQKSADKYVDLYNKALGK